MRSWRALAVITLFALPLVQAGSQGDPEIRDGTNDVDVVHGGVIALGAPEIDLTSAWFTADATTVGFSWQVVDASHRVQHDEERVYGLTFACGADGVSAFVGLLDPDANGGPNISAMFVAHPNGSYGYAWLPLSVVGNTIHVDMPRSLLQCATITRSLASTLVAFHMGDGWSSGGSVGRVGDVAPNSGYGRDVPLT